MIVQKDNLSEEKAIDLILQYQFDASGVEQSLISLDTRVDAIEAEQITQNNNITALQTSQGVQDS